MLKDDLDIYDSDIERCAGLENTLAILDNALDKGDLLDVFSLTTMSPVLVDTNSAPCILSEDVTLENVGIKVIYPAQSYEVVVSTEEGELTVGMGTTH